MADPEPFVHHRNEARDVVETSYGRLEVQGRAHLKGREFRAPGEPEAGVPPHARNRQMQFVVVDALDAEREFIGDGLKRFQRIGYRTRRFKELYRHGSPSDDLPP